MNLKNILTVAGTAFLTGFGASLATVPPAQLLSWPSAKPFIVAAVLGGAASVYHLYVPAPKS
jgi:hypothetical protein